MKTHAQIEALIEELRTEALDENSTKEVIGRNLTAIDVLEATLPILSRDKIIRDACRNSY